jgi:hypothetical protein
MVSPVQRSLPLTTAAAVVVLMISIPGALAAPPGATALFPAGGGRGQTIDVTAVGSFDGWPVKSWVNEPGLEIEPGEKKGQFTVRVAADASPGLRWIRLYDEQGATALLPFDISPTPGLVEREPNDAPEQAQPIESLPVVIDGRLEKAGDVDGFAIELQAGQTLVASLKGQRLGAPMDAVLQIVSADGFVLRQADDDIGLDPQLVYEVPAAGMYVVRCFAFPSEPNSTIGFAGGDAYIYRLLLTTGPYLDHAFPLMLSTDDDRGAVEAFGWNLADEQTRLAAEPINGTSRARVWHPSTPHVVELPLTSLPSRRVSDLEVREGAWLLSPPIIVSGRIASPRERHEYRFTATKDQAWQFRVVARDLGSPLDPALQILDDQGKVLAEQDDRERTARDVDLSFKAPQDAEYRLIVQDQTGHGGFRFIYRLEVTEPQPSVRLTMASDRLTIAPGKTETVEITVERFGGIDGPVEVTVDGLPTGVTAAAVKDSPPAGRNRRGASAAVKLELVAGDDAAAFSGPITVTGKADHAGMRLQEPATAALTVPGAVTEQIWLTVLPGSK